MKCITMSRGQIKSITIITGQMTEQKTRGNTFRLPYDGANSFHLPRGGVFFTYPTTMFDLFHLPYDGGNMFQHSWWYQKVEDSVFYFHRVDVDDMGYAVIDQIKQVTTVTGKRHATIVTGENNTLLLSEMTHNCHKVDNKRYYRHVTTVTGQITRVTSVTGDNTCCRLKKNKNK